MSKRSLELGAARDYLATENVAGIEAAFPDLEEMIEEARLIGIATDSETVRQEAIRRMNRLESHRLRLLRVRDANLACNGYRNAGLEPWIKPGALCPCPKAVEEYLSRETGEAA